MSHTPVDLSTRTTVSPDRAWLWRLAGMLAASATSSVHHALGAELARYLRDTCVHAWALLPADPRAAAAGLSRDVLQCSHCHTVREAPESPVPPSPVAVPGVVVGEPGDRLSPPVQPGPRTS
jgi:hypothetical protein